MFSVIDLIQVIESLVPYTYYANDFPAKSPDAAAFVRMEPGLPASEWTPLRRPSFQILIRGEENSEPELEAIANQVFAALHNKNDFLVGPTRIVHCAAEQSVPFYIGRDDNRRPMYSLNFMLTFLQ